MLTLLLVHFLAGGNQIVTTVMTTYAVDCYREEAASVGVFISFVRQIWGECKKQRVCPSYKPLLMEPAIYRIYRTILVPSSHRTPRFRRHGRPCLWTDDCCLDSTNYHTSVERQDNEMIKNLEAIGEAS